MLRHFRRFAARYLADGCILRDSRERHRGPLKWKDWRLLGQEVRRLGVRTLFFDTPEMTDGDLRALRNAVPDCYFVSFENYFNDLSLFDLNLDMGYDRGPRRPQKTVEGSLRFSVFDPSVFECKWLSGELPEEPTVMVSFGGTDIGDCSSRALGLLRDTFRERCTIHAVVGPYFGAQHALRSVASGSKKVTVHEAPSSLYSLMEQCDFGILNSGTTYLESLVVGLPSFAVPQNGYERKLRDYLSDRFGLPGYDGFTQQHVEEWLNGIQGCAAGTKRASEYFRSFNGIKNLEAVIVDRFEAWGASRHDTTVDSISGT
jgi:hypothetical protein